jgi:CRISPR-associated protein Cas5h
MKALFFELSGKTAIFKKPDVNSYSYFTYNNIHRIALLGLLGAILGLGGYNQQSRKIKEQKSAKNKGIEDANLFDFPEFYQVLNPLKVSIVPKGIKGYFSKKIQVFNNSVGYASKEEGGNLIVREQWLENPCWDIFILDNHTIDFNIFGKLEDYLINKKCEFIPYLGKNDHIAQINHCQKVDLIESNNCNIDSLFMLRNIQLDRFVKNDARPFMFKEIAPISMNGAYNFYEFEEFAFTNLKIRNPESLAPLYSYQDLTLSFF